MLYQSLKSNRKKKKDEKTIEKYELPVEDSQESDNEDKSNLSYDENDIKEAYENILENENQINNITVVKISKKYTSKQNA